MSKTQSLLHKDELCKYLKTQISAVWIGCVSLWVSTGEGAKHKAKTQIHTPNQTAEMRQAVCFSTFELKIQSQQRRTYVQLCGAGF